MEDKFQERQLTPHFNLKEFVLSGTAIKQNIDNTPDEKQIARLQALCTHVLEPLRRAFGVIRITSGYRSKQLNEAVGGVAASQHLRGEAADIHISNEEVGQKMFNFIRRNCTFDQLLFEHKQKDGSAWLHVSYKSDGGENRRSVATVP